MLGNTLDFLIDKEMDPDDEQKLLVHVYYQNLKPDQLERRIQKCLQSFSRLQSIFAAQALVDHIETLLNHRGFCAPVENRCCYRQLQRRLILWLQGKRFSRQSYS